MKKKLIIVILLCVFGIIAYRVTKKINFNSDYEVGQPVDSLNHVVVYFNGGVDNNSGRNTSIDGYNIGIKYQCVEFVKRYYYQHLNHKMPDAFGHAKDFFNNDIDDGELNKERNLLQYKNGSKSKPQPDDLLIFDGYVFNKYGHVAIISSVSDSDVEIIQQNPGPFGKTRESIKLLNDNGTWKLDNERILGWLRKKK